MAQRTPFRGLRVIEISSGIGAAYCGKLFSDAGAEVVTIEPPDGNPMRRWSASGAEPGPDESGVLFGYLHAGKTSVVATPVPGSVTSALLTSPDLVVTDGSGGWTAALIRDLLPADSPTVIVSVTPFGLDGPYVTDAIATNDLVLQAMCGSIGTRGWPGEAPLQAGGRIGEWVSGVRRGRCGSCRPPRPSHRPRRPRRRLRARIHGRHNGRARAVSASVHRDQQPAFSRSLELPSIVPTADGLVGFCTITAQQFADFMVMIDRPDLLDDRDLSVSWAANAAVTNSRRWSRRGLRPERRPRSSTSPPRCAYRSHRSEPLPH